MRSLAVTAAALLLLVARSAGAGPAPLDLAPFAMLEAAPFTRSSIGFSELDKGPGAVRDGDPATAWEVPGEEGETATLTFDWSTAGGVEPFPVSGVRIDIDPAGAAIGVAAGRDRDTFAETAFDAAPDDTGVTLTLKGAPALRVLRLTLPAGAHIANIVVQGGPTTGTLTATKATCDENGVHIDIDGTGLLGVEASRALPAGGAVTITQRRTTGAVLTDAGVRFDPRPASYTYSVRGIGSSDAPVDVEVKCAGAALDRPAVGPIHGVIEGFYGRAWTWHERAKVVLAMGALGMDTYIYAPKQDPKHRDQWREPYDADAMSHFKDLADVGRGVGVNVVWAVSPGKDIDPSKQDDVDALIDKVASMADGAGIRDAALLMDDLSAAHGAALGQAHSALAKALLASMKARDPASRLFFVPTVYAGLAGDLAQADKDYLAALADIPVEVPIAWTGQGVFSKTITLDDAAAFGALAGRAKAGVWVWDNYPVNDIEVLHRLHTHPITGRETLLPDSGGLLSNPMRHALASIPAIASYAEMALDPVEYAAARAGGKPLQTADLTLVLADAADPPRALGDLFAEMVHHDTLWPDEMASPGLTKALADYGAAMSPGQARRDAALDLGTRLARLAVSDVDLRRDLDDAALADEIDAYARATSVSARAALAGLSAERAASLGADAAAKQARSEAACLWLSADQPSWRTIQEAVAPLIPESAGGVCPDEDPSVIAKPQLAAAFQPWSFDVPDGVSEQGATTSLVGPDGAAISAAGRIDWTPPRLGPFRLVALRSGDTGVTATVIDIDVVEKLPDAGPGTQIEPAGGCGCRTGIRGAAEDGALFLGALLAAVAIRRRRRRPS